MKKVKPTCSICSRGLAEMAVHAWKDGNNAAPYPDRCCDECNLLYVIPARIARISGGFMPTYEQVRLHAEGRK